MSVGFEYVYLHGFRGDVFTQKGQILKKRLGERGIDLHLLDVKGGKGHADTRVSIGLEALNAHYRRREKPLRLLGSSMGGFISLLYASQHPERVDRAILLNPAVNLKDTWVTITDTDDPTKFEEWKREGAMEFEAGHDYVKVHIPFAYVEDSLQFPSFPNVSCPTVVMVGSKDKLVPPKNGYVLQLEQEDPARMKLVEVDDDHDFLKPETIERIWEEVGTFFT